MKKNIILKTVDEINLFTKRIKREIAWNEKHTFLILSNTPLFELKKLENYLFENTLNELAKAKILDASNNFIQLDNDYQKIKATEIFYDYNFENIYTGTNCNKLLYFFYSEDSLLKIDKEKFNELMEKSNHFNDLTQSEILTYCKNIIALINPEEPQLKKTIFQFIHNIEDKDAFLLALKNAFPTEKGKSIKAIIDLLVNEDILIIGEREYKHFVELLTSYFGRNIGTYNGIQNNKTIEKPITDSINKKLNPLINIHKTT